MGTEFSSFRDPAGRVFISDGDVYRSVFRPGASDFEAARDTGVHALLQDAGLLIPHQETRPDDRTPPHTIHCLKYPRLPMVSYPWEWAFSMLKDAALLHLDIMEKILPLGFWLRDASAFNVQYDGSGLRLIDTLSIGRRPAGSPWIAYGQFCSHFLAPLVMAAYRDIRTLGLWRNHIDGYPLDLAVTMLPFRVFFNPRLFMHLKLHARAQLTADRRDNLNRNRTRKKPQVSDLGLIGLIRSLRRTIEGLRWKPRSRIWDQYLNLRTYSEKDISTKTRFIRDAVGRAGPATVWDLGANTGEHSMISAASGAFVVSIDGDPACTEHVYRQILPGGHKIRSILPLTMDLANPSPGLGWKGMERLSLTDRGPADLVLALALVHHLVLTSYVPLSMIAAWFAELGRNAVVEFVPPDDGMVQKLLRNRNGGHLPYDQNTFQTGFGRFFEVLDRVTLENGRILFFMKNKFPSNV
jgi:hypothetical protein